MRNMLKSFGRRSPQRPLNDSPIDPRTIVAAQADHVLELLDDHPGLMVEMSPEVADLLGEFEETALDESSAMAALSDQPPSQALEERE